MKTLSKTFKISMLAIFAGLLATLVMCKKEDNKSSKADITFFSIALQADSSTIDVANKKISIKVKYNADLKSLKPEIKISENATISPASGETVDFSSGKAIYTITAEDGTKVIWEISVEKEAENEKKIVSFVVDKQIGDAVISDSTVSITVTAEVSLDSIVPTITISSNTTIQPASGTKIDFTKGAVTFTIVAADGSSKKYTVSISRMLNDEANILGFKIENQKTEKIDTTKKTVTIQMPDGTDIKAIAPIISISKGGTITPASGTVVDFSKGAVEYTVTSETGVKKTFTVKVISYIALISASNSKIKYTGRIDFSNPEKPKYSAPGAYIITKFKGTSCDFDMSAEGSQNYIQIKVDDLEPQRVLVQSARKIYSAAKDLADGEHTLFICKETEASMGSLIFYGLRCKELLDVSLPERKLESYGNSITVGAKMLKGEMCDLSASNWNAPNKASASYAAVTARNLNARWHLTAVSGIGLIQSCCNMPNTMPMTYNRLFLEKSNSPEWDFNSYIPDVVTICLGQNDGTQIVNSDTFKTKYIEFVKTLRARYPSAKFFLITSPMADYTLFNAMKKSIDAVISVLNTDGVTNVFKVELPYNKHNGCDNAHPGEQEHIEVATVLTNAIKNEMGW